MNEENDKFEEEKLETDGFVPQKLEETNTENNVDFNKNINIKKILVFIVIILILVTIGTVSTNKLSEETETEVDSVEEPVTEEKDDDNTDTNIKVRSKGDPTGTNLSAYEKNIYDILMIDENIAFDTNVLKSVLKSFDDIFYSEKLYLNDVYSIDNISNYALIATAVSHMDVVSSCESDKTIPTNSIQELNDSLNKYILDKKITIEDIKRLPSYSSSESYTVNNVAITLDGENLKLSGPCDGHFQDYVLRKVINVEKQDDYIYIYEKHAFYDFTDRKDENGNAVADYYKDYERKILLEKDVEYDLSSISPHKQEPNWDLYDTYKFTYKIVDGNYYFEKVEHLREKNDSKIGLNYKIIKDNDAIEKIKINDKIVDLEATNIDIITELEDALIIKAWFMDNYSVVAIDKDANIITEIVGKDTANVPEARKIYYLQANIPYDFKYSEGKLYFTSVISQDPDYSACVSDDDKIIGYEEEFEYAGNGIFNSKIINRISASQQIKNKNLDCSSINK